MPIYAYKCESCGKALDVLQKMSDPVLVDCPSCGASALQKQLTAAGFQLKGSGWYATDFKGGGAPSAPAAAESGTPAAAETAATTAPAKTDTASASVTAPASAPAAPTAGPAAT